jgi:signal transduction histidine kinase
MCNEETRREPSANIDEVSEAARDELKRSAADRAAPAAQQLSLLGEMTGGIVHDFRNILSVIDSGLRLAEINVGDVDKIRICISGAREGVARGLSLTEQLLNFAHQSKIRTCVADANALLKSLELFLKYATGPDVHIVLDCCPTIPKCLVDPSLFAAAILNLVINARDAMPGGGEVRIKTTRIEANFATCDPGLQRVYVLVRVQDNGSGMPGHVVQKIFEPFFTTKGDKGTGLGVPQVRAFMLHSGGHIDVASEQGRGTTIDLFFPAVEPDYFMSCAKSATTRATQLPLQQS